MTRGVKKAFVEDDKTTLTRIKRGTLKDMQLCCPKVGKAELIEMSWTLYKSTNRLGKFIYGAAWNDQFKNKKK